MADNLIFPIGFDLDKAVEQAGKDWDGKFADKLEKLIAKRPVNVKLNIDVKSINDITAQVRGISGLSPTVRPKIDTSSFEGALKSLQISLQSVDYESLTEQEASAIKTLTGAVNSLTRAYSEKNKAAALEDKVGQELRAATAAEKRAKAELTAIKAIEQRGKKEANIAIAKANQVKAEENAITAVKKREKAEADLLSAQNKRLITEKKLAASSARMEKAQLALKNAQDKSANNIRNTNKAYAEQSTYLDRLIKRLAVYWSVRQVRTFISSVRDVTAEFELQRVSLGAIIQDQQRANQLFAEIKSFALTSPLKILDLTKYTKQVAAYGIETEKLFDTTKMLADISVGLGVDMSRLTLFLGQVYATGYLRASEVRQATEAGIPLVDKLAEKLSEANGRLVSAAEVMDLISKRAISFEQVEDIFKDMTSAGGMFYNMQVKQSQTLFGMWSKLGDAAAMMYDQIGNTESVNTGMKTLMRLLESMMRNWKTTARVLDTVGMGLIVYVAGLKKAAIESQALSVSEAARLAITKSQVIMTPKLVAAIIGQNKATKLSTVLTKAHTVAMLKQATATSVLSRAFWSLSAALLANPWIAVAAAVAGATAALIHFTGNAETASERAEKLNNTVASFKTLEDTTGNLISEYNELIDKTERTASEQKKLSAVTHELAKQYPGAITAVGNFGDEVELAADKLNQLYQTEKQARMDNTRYELDETEKKIKEVEAEIEKYQQKLASGEKTIYKRLGDSGLRVKKVVPLTEEDKGDILKMIDDLRYGEDGQSGLLGLQQSAEAARRALGLIPSEASQAVEKFGAWKKKLTEFKKDVGGINIKLFDEGTIEQFGTLDEALNAAAKKYKEATESVEQYNRTLSKENIKKLTQDQIDKISAERDEAQAMKELSEEALKYYNAMALILKATSGGAQSDPRLGILQEMVSTLKQVNKEYDDLVKKEGATKALADTQKTYADTFKNMQALAKQYKFDLPGFGVPTDTASLTKYLDAIKKAMAKLPKSQKAVLSLEVDIAKLDTDAKQKQIDEQLKVLADRVSRTKTAQEFYDRILGSTGDINIAANVTMSIYGDAGTDVQAQMAEYISGLFGGFDVEVPVNVISSEGAIDYTALEKFVRDNADRLGSIESDTYKELLKIAQDGQNQMAKTYEGYLKDLEVAKTYADKRIELARDTANKIAEIERSKLPQAEKDRLKAGYTERESREAAKLEYEAFKDTPLYTQMFEDLDYASTSALTRMRDRLVTLKGQWKNLDPTQLKELQRRLDEIDNQLATRNPFKALIDSFKQWNDLRKSGRTRKGNELAADTAETARKEAEKKMIADEKAYQAAVKESGAMSDAAKAARETADASKDAYEKAENTANETAKSADEWKDIGDKIKNAVSGLDEYQQGINDALGGIRNIMDAFGVSDEDMQFFDDIVGGFNKVVDGGKQAASAVASFMAGDIFGGVTKSISAIGSLVSGFMDIFNAGRIRNATKEIKKQQEELEQLEYTYGRLQKAAEDLFGSDYIQNFNQQIEALRAQADAYQKQAEAEKSKGKKKDEEKVKDFEQSYQETMDAIEDRRKELAEHFAGSDLTSAARDWARAWIDAKTSFSNTTDAMKEKFADMMKNMIVESMAAAVMKQALKPFYDELEKAMEDERLSAEDIVNLSNIGLSSIDDANAAMELFWNTLKAKGIDIKEMFGEGAEDLTGISRDIASASEERINGLAAGINTQNFYVSHLPKIAENVQAIRMLMESGGMPSSGGMTMTDLVTMQNQHLSQLPVIAANTAEMVVRCERAAAASERSAAACENISLQLGRVIKPKGTPASHSVSTTIN